MAIDKILLLLLICTFLHASAHAQETRINPTSNSIRTRTFTENARAIDSIRSMDEGTNAIRRNNLSATLAGAKLIRKENNPKPNILQQSTATNQSINQQAGSAFRTNAICYTISGRNFLKQDSLVLYTNDACKTKDGNVIVTGELGEYTPYLVESGGYCIKTDIEGNVLWAKLYDSIEVDGSDYTYYTRVIELTNGSILLAGRTKNKISGNDDFVLTKLDNNGNLIWMKTYEARLWQGFNGSGDSFPLTDLEEDPATTAAYV